MSDEKALKAWSGRPQITAPCQGSTGGLGC